MRREKLSPKPPKLVFEIRTVETEFLVFELFLIFEF